MKQAVRFSILVILILYIEVECGNFFTRRKKDVDRWEWGVEETTTIREITYMKELQALNVAPNTTIIQKSAVDAIPADVDDPCTPYEPVKPNFRKEGRRISESKCYDYIWEMKKRSDLVDRVKKCHDKKNLNFRNFVIGGKPTKQGDFPHMAAIGWQGVDTPWLFKCGGSLISETFVLTAGHCAEAPPDTSIVDPAPKLVRLGNKNVVGVVVKDINIKRIIVHPRYAPPQKYYDIALMELESSPTFSKFIQPACLYVYDDLKILGDKANVTGWGVTEEKSSGGTSELQIATVDLIDSKSCDEYLKRYRNRQWTGLSSDQLCAGKLEGGIDVCQGDSGGPLQVEINLPIKDQGHVHYIIGITSFGKGCARADTPGVYTRVSSFIDWIEQYVWPSGK